ncbi:MAG: dNTP triphosphohydrolase [Campylobacterales bacterium]|nr:dNTP triphosphohydrolase [Campylobacterales bacterium]
MRVFDRFHAIKDDFRDPYSRDRDRVIHSSSFRRLEYKTQVFLNSDGDYFRTRLTHTLEVSQIARSLAKNLNLNETLAEVIALSHDLGHTPFGHIGGDEIDRLLKADGYKNGFEHNFQSFRVVSYLEKRYLDFDGLNLTFATLEGILKHSKPYKKKFFSNSLDDIFKFDYHPSLEAIIVDSADEIAYISHDIDDGIKYGLITFDDLLDSELVCEIFEVVKKQNLTPNDKIFRYRFTAEMINNLVYTFLENSKYHNYPTDTVLSKQIKATEELKIGFDKELKEKIAKLKSILVKKLYRNEQIVKRMFLAKRCIEGLYKAFMSEYNLLPSEYKVRFEKKSKHRVIADYIAGMSDRFALKLYNELYGKV